MSNGTEMGDNPSEKIEVVRSSEVLFTEQQLIIQSLKQELEVNKKRIAELQDSIRRLTADFENYKKWTAKERQTIERTAAESLIKKLLDMYESLGKAVSTKTDTKENDFIEGIKMIYKEFSRILKSEGLEPIPSVGLPLDVYKHEVVMQKVNDEVPEDTVLDEIQRGYLLNNFVLRAAKVVVSQKSAIPENTQNSEKSEEDKGG
ncbi:heat shock protein GrpE [Candidatus Brocadiaceae bacterium B188]|jgi:molecular chaperone GrpE|nr:nucleotide exchange factor GrpE [Candidatus Brocadia sapporoensis]OQZ03072.1 MAG: nucleotide exchange factor GrpE [Candidatus Brocadia sp. UTAMX1]QQR67498.1 MAG: nucleotide exchange factor GrpE [Candidatus Brocadia sp.]RZV58899.1 MAG: nucleotide exchange factor GrpE [Candidatus Brocadia sp. BROELEC01]TWU52314.1 heat shock protein GrpE [Candidatus Brocadiaceae bacterium B188]